MVFVVVVDVSDPKDAIAISTEHHVVTGWLLAMLHRPDELRVESESKVILMRPRIRRAYPDFIGAANPKGGGVGAGPPLHCQGPPWPWGQSGGPGCNGNGGQDF